MTKTTLSVAVNKMDSYLITGATIDERKKKAQEISAVRYQISGIDTISLTPTVSLGISEIRDLEHKIALKPYLSKQKSVIIDGAEKLTIEAQNALLKTLEEPPINTIIILTACQEEFLLPTIVSRCQIIKLKGKPEIELTPEVFSIQYSVFSSLVRSGVGERIKIAGEIAKTREETIKWLEQMTIVLRQILLGKFQSKRHAELVSASSLNLTAREITAIIRKLGGIKRLIEKNVNFRLALEIFFLSLPKLP